MFLRLIFVQAAKSMLSHFLQYHSPYKARLNKQNVGVQWYVITLHNWKVPDLTFCLKAKYGEWIFHIFLSQQSKILGGKYEKATVLLVQQLNKATVILGKNLKKATAVLLPSLYKTTVILGEYLKKVKSYWDRLLTRPESYWDSALKRPH